MSQKPSNGTMGHMWFERWCFRCVNDHAFSHREPFYEADGCDLAALLMAGEDPPEFVSHETPRDGRSPGAWSPDLYECRLFERCPCNDDPGWEPPAVPTPDPNQGLLFEVIDETPFTPMVVIPHEEDARV